MVIQASGLGAWIEGREVLHAIELSVRAGECVALVGANGAGKTTTLRVLATLLPIARGRLELFGRVVRGDSSALRARLSMIGHGSMLYSGLTVRENLELFGRLHRVADPRARAGELLGLVGLDAHGNERVGSLSRGMTRRAAIARALVHDPELLLADEPWSGLDRGAAEVLDTVLMGMLDRGRTVVLTSHDLERVLRTAGRVVALREGQIVLETKTTGCDMNTLAEAITGRTDPAESPA